MEHCPVCNGPLAPEDAACPQCGFKVTGSTQEFKPIADVAPAAPAAAASGAPQLKVVRGPQQIDTAYTLERREMTVGRSPQCDIFLNDMTVSREHAVVVPVGDDFAIKDTMSYNGVWVNNENVTQQVLHEGDIVQIGAFCLLYRR